jgi:Na+-translocating ferredoxin:NAD+ oxidoreductase subunit G
MTTTGLPLRQQPRFMALLLGGFALLVCGSVAVSSRLTAPQILMRQQEDTQRLLAQVLPSSLYDNMPSQDEVTLTLDGQPVHFFRARQGGKVSAIALFASTRGYGGEILMLLGIDTQGTLTGVRVISHTETPGLGDKIDTAKSDWVLGFNGLSLHKPDEKGWHVKKDGGQFDSFTGATITPRGVVKGIHESLQLFAKHSAELLDQSPAKPTTADEE